MDRVLVMGVVNVTPDSFSDGGAYLDPVAAIAHGRQLLAEGADILDIGGEATNPRATPVTAAEELARVLPVIEALAKTGARISIDTTKAEVARAAVGAGASIVNDVSGGLFDPAMAATVGELGVTYIAGHLRGRSLAEVFAAEGAIASPAEAGRAAAPQAVRRSIASPAEVGRAAPPQAVRRSIASPAEAGRAAAPQAVRRSIDWREVAAELAQRLDELPAGARSRAWIDPGVGFGKGADPEGNLALLRRAGDLGRALGCPVVVGPSRKRFVKRLLPEGQQRDALAVDVASVAACLGAVRWGATIVRAHNVALLRAALAVYTKL